MQLSRRVLWRTAGVLYGEKVCPRCLAAAAEWWLLHAVHKKKWTDGLLLSKHMKSKQPDFFAVVYSKQTSSVAIMAYRRAIDDQR
jgi:hypothetical protein